MDNQLLKVVALVAVAALAVCGCQEKDAVVIGPTVDSVAGVPEFAAKSLEATGGGKSWQNTQKFALDGVVTFYRADGSSYLTEHRFEVHPQADSIVVSATEPQSKFVWLLAAGQFSAIEGAGAADVSGRRISARDVAEAVLLITTAPVRLLDASAVHDRSGDAVKLEGNWYYPISRSVLAEGEVAAPYWSSVTLFQNKANAAIDTVHLAGEGKMLSVRGYDYVKTKRGGVLVPTKIEVFNTDSRGVLKDRLVKIDVK